ncbi:MAG: transposase, partial [Desulfobacterales bacterium]
VDKSNKSSDWKTFRKKLTRLVMDAVRLDDSKAKMADSVFVRRKMKLYTRLGSLIESPRQDKDVNRLIKRLIRHRNELFTFLEYENVSPYNNHAERQMRTPVKTRKISFQNRSDRGAEAQATFLSLFGSAQLQELNPVEKVLLDVEEMLKSTKSQNTSAKMAA